MISERQIKIIYRCWKVFVFTAMLIFPFILIFYASANIIGFNDELLIRTAGFVHKYGAFPYDFWGSLLLNGLWIFLMFIHLTIIFQLWLMARAVKVISDGRTWLTPWKIISYFLLPLYGFVYASAAFKSLAIEINEYVSDKKMSNEKIMKERLAFAAGLCIALMAVIFMIPLLFLPAMILDILYVRNLKRSVLFIIKEKSPLVTRLE
ncbi:MAG: hypothetical protein ABIJ16_04905 [Bacteroidota bacterium]